MTTGMSSRLARLLKLAGDTTEVAHDGPEALAAVERFTPDVILLDIGLPSMSGYNVCRRLRERTADWKPVIVALTGWATDEDRRQSTRPASTITWSSPCDEQLSACSMACSPLPPAPKRSPPSVIPHPRRRFAPMADLTSDLAQTR